MSFSLFHLLTLTLSKILLCLIPLQCGTHCQESQYLQVHFMHLKEVYAPYKLLYMYLIHSFISSLGTHLVSFILPVCPVHYTNA